MYLESFRDFKVVIQRCYNKSFCVMITGQKNKSLEFVCQKIFDNFLINILLIKS
jgi:hypothetical protein